MKPSSNEEEYFARQEADRKRQAELLAERKKHARRPHHLKCPRCGTTLEERDLEGIRIDRCSACEGIWLDKGELAAIRSSSPRLTRALLTLFGG